MVSKLYKVLSLPSLYLPHSPPLPLTGSTGAAGPRLFTIHLVDQPTGNLPKAHTWYKIIYNNTSSDPLSLSLPHSFCSFNRMDLPPYDSYDLLYEKLTIAVEQTIGFHVE